MEIKIDSAALKAIEEQIDAHFEANQENWDKVMAAVRAAVPIGIQRRIERHEDCTFAEWLDESLYKWDGRSVNALVSILQKRAERVP